MVLVCFICGSLERKTRMYRVPEGEIERWSKVCKRTMGSWSRLCEIHFEKDCFKDLPLRKILKPGSVPTLFLTPPRMAHFIQDAPPTTGFKNLQSRVQTVCLSPSKSMRKPRIKSKNPMPKEDLSLEKPPTVCETQSTIKTQQNLPRATINPRGSPTLLVSQPTTSLPRATINPIESPTLLVSQPTISPTNPSNKRTVLTIPRLRKTSAFNIPFLPPSLKITVKPMPHIEFVSVNTPTEPLSSKNASKQISPVSSTLSTKSEDMPLLPSSLKVQIKPISISATSERLKLLSAVKATPGFVSGTSQVKNSTPANIEKQIQHLPCKITKIDASQKTSWALNITKNPSPRLAHPSASTEAANLSHPFVATESEEEGEKNEEEASLSHFNVATESEEEEETRLSNPNVSNITTDTTLASSSHSNVEKIDSSTQTLRMHETITSELYRENLTLKRESTLLRADIKRLKKKLDVEVTRNRNIAKLFTKNQMKKLVHPKRSVYWEWEDICWALTIHSSGPKAYKQLYKKGFPVPSIQILQRWLKNMKFKNGILTPVIDILKETAELQTDARACVLCFGEIELSYIDMPRKAMAQVAIVRGLELPWKHPIFYDFNCVMSKTIIDKIIRVLYTAGFTVVAMVVSLDKDQSLLEELDISVERTWFAHPCDKNAKIFTFIDAPQLLNLIRNQFIDGGFICDGQLITAHNVQQILLNHLSELKLDNKHLEIKNFGRERISIASTLFSSTIAEAILKYKSNDSSDGNHATECATFIDLIESWFNIFTSTKSSVSTNEAFGLSLDSQIETLESVNELMTQNVILDTSPSLFSLQDGVILTNKSLCDLFEYLKINYEIEQIHTSQFSQDILEQFFDDLRGDKPASQKMSITDFQLSLQEYLISRSVKHFRKSYEVFDNKYDDMDSSEEQADNIEQEERSTEENEDINLSSENNATLEDGLMDVDIEDIDKDAENLIEDFCMNDII